ncbi:MAG: class II aldolase/adducin family protein [Firmicutes bacterium]|nr:class II aldolase/adducin family protein [Bacillota bacterium]
MTAVSGSSDLQRIKEEIIFGMKVLRGEGVLEQNMGHLSYRLDDGNICMIGHLHDKAKTFDEMGPEDMVVIDPDGKLVEGTLNPVGERVIHTAVLAARPDVRSVIHAHPKTSMLFGITGQPILPVYMNATIFAPSVPILDYAAQIDTPELGRQVAETLGNNYALLLRGHGTVSVGADIREAVVVAVMLEAAADLQWRASVLGTPRPVRMDELDGRNVKGTKHAHNVANQWAFYSQKY